MSIIRSIHFVLDGQSLGDNQWRIDQRSTTLLAIGVPVKAKRISASPVADQRARLCLDLGSFDL
jgi:hypothetical protein